MKKFLLAVTLGIMALCSYAQSNVEDKEKVVSIRRNAPFTL